MEHLQNGMLTDGSVCRRCIEGGDTSSTCSTFLSHGALRDQFELELPSEILALEKFVLSNVRRNHLANLARLEQLAYVKASMLATSQDIEQQCCYILSCLPSPTPGMPALFETTVKSTRSLRSRMLLINVAGTPENPNPPTRIVSPLFTLAIASSALGQILLMASCRAVAENVREAPYDCRHTGLRNKVLCIVV